MKDILKNKGCLIGCAAGGVLLVCAVVIVVVFMVGKGGSIIPGVSLDPNYGVIKTEQGETYPCLLKPETTISNIGTQQFKFVVSTNESLDWGVLRKDNGTRRLSPSALDAGTSANHLYMISYMPDGSNIMKNLTTTYQICDKNNNTVQSSYLEGVSINPISSDFGDGESLSSETEVYSLFLAKVPGNYRMDGLAFYNGQWVLVARMDGLELN